MSASSSFTLGTSAIWTYTRPITADNTQDRAFNALTLNFVYAWGSYSGSLSDHGSNKGSKSITLPAECVAANGGGGGTTSSSEEEEDEDEDDDDDDDGDNGGGNNNGGGTNNGGTTTTTTTGASI